LRFVVAVGSVDTFVPAEQVRVVVQTRGEVAEPADDWYCKLVHVMCGLQVVWLDVSWYSVAPWHAVFVAPSTHLCPSGHWMQLLLLLRCEPALHCLHAVELGAASSWYLLPGHAPHTRPAVSEGACDSYVPAPHVMWGKQKDVPVLCWYFPTGHSAQWAPEVCALPGSPKRPAAHAVQTPSSIAAVAFE
jgi:hypothetical protein